MIIIYYIVIKILDKTCTLHACVIGDEIEYACSSLINTFTLKNNHLR